MTRLATFSDAGAAATTISEGFEIYRAWAPPDWTPPVVGEGDLEQFAGALARPDVWFLLALSDGAVIGPSPCRCPRLRILVLRPCHSVYPAVVRAPAMARSWCCHRAHAGGGYRGAEARPSHMRLMNVRGRWSGAAVLRARGLDPHRSCSSPFRFRATDGRIRPQSPVSGGLAQRAHCASDAGWCSPIAPTCA
jgi:hypothetical protein